MNSKETKEAKGQKQAVKPQMKKQKMEKEEGVEVNVQVVKTVPQVKQVQQKVKLNQSKPATQPAKSTAKQPKLAVQTKLVVQSKKQSTGQVKAVKSKVSAKDEKMENENAEEDGMENVEAVEESNVYKFEKQLGSIRSEMEEVRDRLRTLSNNLKGLESAYNYDVRKVAKSTRKRTKGKKTGFAKPKVVPDALADFIEVEVGTQLTGPEVTSKVWEQLAKRNLISKDDGKLFKTDKAVSKVFGVPTSVNKITDSKDRVNGFNFYNLQKYVRNAYPKKVENDAEDVANVEKVAKTEKTEKVKKVKRPENAENVAKA